MILTLKFACSYGKAMNNVVIGLCIDLRRWMLLLVLKLGSLRYCMVVAW